MGMRMRKKWDLPPEQGCALAVLAAAFLIGGVAGCLLAALSGGAGAEELNSYLVGYLTLAQNGTLPRGLWTLLWGQAKYLLSALVLGLTALGLAGLPVLFALRGFFFSFPVACFCRVFGGRGLIAAFVLFGLPALLWVPALFMAGVSGLLSARQLFRRTQGESRGSAFFSGAWLGRASLYLGLALSAGLLEHWVIPVLLRGLARAIL